MEINRPQQKKQSSRKGKRAWRKNIDIDDVEIGLENEREMIKTFGEDAITGGDSLFQIDSMGDASLKSRLGKANKVTKISEILNKRSKASGLINIHHKANRIQGVEKKDVHRLMKLAGRVTNESSLKARIEKNGIINTVPEYDIWNQSGEVNPKEAKKPEILKTKSSTSWTVATTLPKTIKEKPILVKEIEVIPHEGKSYNPSLNSWKELLNQEIKTEIDRENKKNELLKYQEKIHGLLKVIDEKEEVDSESDDDDEDNEEENDQYANTDFKLSINAPVKIKKKTKTQRNRLEKHKERVKLEQELKQLKAQLGELQKLKLYTKQAEEKELEEAEEGEEKLSKDKKRVLKKQRLGSKHSVLPDAVEVKLSDELTDSLRKLKPEGSLLHDQMRVLQSKGKIESRIQFKKKRKNMPKITEKWTYKDFK